MGEVAAAKTLAALDCGLVGAGQWTVAEIWAGQGLGRFGERHMFENDVI
jgi:hypothetical protein